MHKLKRGAFALVVTLAMMFALPLSAHAAEGDVAKIGDVGYATFDLAAKAVEDGETIELLADCESNLASAWAINKNVTIKGTHKVTFDDYSFGITGNNTLTLDGCGIVINNAAHTAYSDNPANAAIMLDKGATLTLDNGASLVIDSPAGDGIATWDVADSKNPTMETLNILNG